MKQAGVAPLAARPGLSYIPEIDGLRAIACVLVILFHSAPKSVFSGGFLGVDMFFVLSGYLITGLLAAEVDRKGEIDILYFYWQRALRLIPALLLFLLTYAALAPIVWPEYNHYPDALLAAFYVSDYTYPLFENPYYIRHTWSLAVEEQFYLLWPLVVPFILRGRYSLIILVTIWIFLSIWRISLSGDDWKSYYFPFHTHCTGLIAGAILCLLQRRGVLNVGQALGFLAAICFGILSVSAYIGNSVLSILLAEILSCLIIGCVVLKRSPILEKLLSAKPVVILGKLSYGMYLWHFPFSYYFRQDFGFVPASAATFSMAFIGAVVSYYSVEAWGRAMKAQARMRLARKADVPGLVSGE